MCTIFSNSELSYKFLSSFTPRKQSDFKLDRLIEDLLDRINKHVAESRRRKRQQRQKKAKELSYLDKLKQLDRIAINYKKCEEKKKQTDLKILRKKLKIPDQNKITVTKFAPEGTPIPEFNFEQFNLRNKT